MNASLSYPPPLAASCDVKWVMHAEDSGSSGWLKLGEQTSNFQKNYRFYKYWAVGHEEKLFVKCFTHEQASQ
jgi:hypothetical protein